MINEIPTVPTMLISNLHDRLRTLVGERIHVGELTGTELAERAGFQQAHISNFLNHRRGLSIEAMDRVMEVLGVEVRDLLPAVNRSYAADGSKENEFHSIPVVSVAALLQSEFGGNDVLEYLCYKKSFLRRIRAEMASRREHWQRFALVRADKEWAEAMHPRLQAGAMLLIDRHYNSLRGYRKNEPNLYVVRHGEGFTVRYVELNGNQLTLRPENRSFLLAFEELTKGKNSADYLAGRVVHMGIET